MQMDTRRLTVARDHLQTADEEITRAIGLTERSMAEQAANRARDQLDLVVRRLADHAAEAAREEQAPATAAHSAARRAWQCMHDALNDWEVSSPGALQDARNSVQEALAAVDQAEQVRRTTAHT